MLYSLKGTIVYYDASSVAIECGGIAYQCQASLSTVAQIGKIGEDALVFTYMHVREGAVDLFGFAAKSELSCFKMLIGVTGVGPKAALSILSQIPPEHFAFSVASGDYKALTVAPGIGAKLAQRIVLELKDKISSGGAAPGAALPAAGGKISGNTGEAVAALAVLGYSHSEASAAVGSLPPDLPVEEMIKAGLRALARG